MTRRVARQGESLQSFRIKKQKRASRGKQRAAAAESLCLIPAAFYLTACVCVAVCENRRFSTKFIFQSLPGQIPSSGGKCRDLHNTNWSARHTPLLWSRAGEESVAWRGAAAWLVCVRRLCTPSSFCSRRLFYAWLTCRRAYLSAPYHFQPQLCF